MADNLKVSVVERGTYRTVGMKVRTSMDKAGIDCPRLWSEDFGPRMPEIQGFPTFSFGASLMVDENEFDYWAVMPLPEGAPVPEGMAVLEIPAGLYAECLLSSLDELMNAYKHMFYTWLPDSGYEYACNAPGYELYPPDHLETGLLSLYTPVRRKSG